ncbi:MAG: hypothetical protein PF505_05265 [Vallitaleaceae bacterium]|jgi:hypothetical protein|nr:hypothetical protein [Vallitaleaceae bacterium]
MYHTKIKKILLSLVLVIMILTTTSCVNEKSSSQLVVNNQMTMPDSPPTISILLSDEQTLSSTVVPYVLLWNVWKGAIADRPSSNQAMNSLYHNGIDMPKGVVGSRVEIDFGIYDPDTINLYRANYISKDGTGESMSIKIAIEMVNEDGATGQYRFQVPTGENDDEFHQFVYTLTATWQEDSMDYAFVIETVE